MARYRVSDEQYSEIINADSDQDAEDQAVDSWQAGSWDGKCLITLNIQELDDDGNELDDSNPWSVDVECGDDPEPPACVDDSDHEWVSPVEVVGGLKENPGVWSAGGTTMIYESVCCHCGCYKLETEYGLQRNPGQCDTVEYLPPSERSLEWVAEHTEE